MSISRFLHRRHRNGYIFLVSVLVIGAIASATAASLLLLSWAAEQSSLSVQQSHQAQEYALACAEKTIHRLRRDVTYLGNQEIFFDNGSCAVSFIGGSGYTDRAVCIAAQSGNSTKRIELYIENLFPTVSIRSWEEVSAFSLCTDA